MNQQKKTKWYMDMRERDLCEKLTSKLSFETKALDIGDMQIIDIESNEILVLIERKTLSDLSSSITDGRYKEQKQRLLHAISNRTKKIYVIEGEDMTDFHLDKSVFDGVMINTVVRDGIMIYRTKNLDETMNMMIHIQKNVEDHHEEIMENFLGVPNEKDVEYQIFKTVKKENMTEKIVFRAMLSMIPQVSNTIADVLIEKYENMERMIIEIREEDTSEMLHKISEMKYGTAQRRIGEVTAMRILLHLFDIDEETKTQWMEKTQKKKKTKLTSPRIPKKTNSISLFSE
jgi:ERCC4-type nuclease